MSATGPIGQINRGTLAGEYLYNIAKDKNNKIFVEIGSWNGKGSTRCLMNGLIERFDNCILYSLEAHKPFHDIAKEFWNDRLKTYNTIMRNKLQLIHGRIIEVSEMPPLEDILKSRHASERWEEFYNNDIESFGGCENVFDKLPTDIDVLILDGGEFTTNAEFRKLKDQSRLIICDDSSKYKCEKIREELIADKEFETLIDMPNDRNGFCAFERTV